MPHKLTFALAQLNPIVGDIEGNLSKLRVARDKAATDGADIVLTSELYLCAYPPEDLVLKPSFQDALQDAIYSLAKETEQGPAILIGVPWRDGGKLYNAMLLLADGIIAAKTYKYDLPNYGPFDEKRVFSSCQTPNVITYKGHKFGVLICEDMWAPTVSQMLKEQGAQILLVPNGSPFEVTKHTQRLQHARARVEETNLPLIYAHQVGGQDELVFDGASFVLNATCECVVQAPAWREAVIMVECNTAYDVFVPTRGVQATIPQGEEAIYSAMVMGLRDYVTKNKFPGVVLGLSGGIDSALVAAVAVDALGADKVSTVMLPSPYTSKDSFEDAEACARNLGCPYNIIPINDTMRSFETTLAPSFVDAKPDVTEENIQARCRGIILMALSNKFGSMVVSTGNKSEMSVGYSTLYGDLCGGYAVLKDLYKTQVFKVSKWRNSHVTEDALGPRSTVIPNRILTKAPTAELRPNQTDQDSLPPYDVLDDILEGLIEADLGVAGVVRKGHDPALVKRVWNMLDNAEYKRRQAPPGVKLTARALSRDRRYPITNKYRES